MKTYLENAKKLLFIINYKSFSIFTLLMLFITASILELISLGILYPYINLVVNPEISINSKPFSYLSPYIDGQEFKDYFKIASILLVFLFLVKTLMSIFIKWFIARFSEKHLSNLLVRLMSAYQNMNYINYLGRDKSEYTRNLRVFIYNCLDGITAILRILSELLIVIALSFYLAFINPYALFSFMFLVLIIFLIYNIFIKTKLLNYGFKKNEAEGIVYQNIADGIRGFKEIRVLSKENFFKNLIKIGADQICKYTIKTNLITFSPRYIFELIIVLFIVIFLFASLHLGKNINLFIPTVSVFAVAGLRMIPACSDIFAQISYLNYGSNGVKVIYDDLKKFEILKNVNKVSNSDHNTKKFSSLKLENISFKYPGTNKNIFENTNFRIQKNQCIGIVGESGSGKTTLVDILLGLLKPQKGKVFINNKESFNTSIDWENMIAYLPQDDLILDQDIKTNVSLDLKSSKQNLKKIESAIQKSNLIEFIQELPDGINTKIGKNGIRLSGGQNKRIALARTFYHDKQVLVMDEATSSLDAKTAKNILEQINYLKKDKTIIIITHQTENLKYCDIIYRIKEKKIILEKKV